MNLSRQKEAHVLELARKILRAFGWDEDKEGDQLNEELIELMARGGGLKFDFIAS